MARKKVYFSTIKIFDSSDEEVSHLELKSIYDNIFEMHAVQVPDSRFKALNLSTEQDKITLDILKNTNEYLYCRVGKRKDNNSMLVRDYETYSGDNVLTPADALKKGVEIFTYFLLNYHTGIFAIVSTQSAPGEKIINRILSTYTNFSSEIVPIPNSDTVQKLYQPGSMISRVSVNLPIPHPDYLESVLGLNEEQIVDILKDDIRSVSLELRGDLRRPLTEDNSKIRNVINSLLNARDDYNKVSVRGKIPGENIQDFDLKSQLFSYQIDVKTYNIENGERIELLIDDLAHEFYINLLHSYTTNIEHLSVLANRHT